VDAEEQQAVQSEQENSYNNDNNTENKTKNDVLSKDSQQGIYSVLNLVVTFIKMIFLK